LDGGTLIDGTGAAPITDAVVVVEGARITAVGRRGQVSVPANADVIKLDGRTILPGLIESHVHLEEWQLPMFLPYGVTTIVDSNNDTAWIIAQREALKSGLIKGPRMFVAGSAVQGPLLGHRVGVFNTRIAATEEDARAETRSRVADGVDLIKVQLDLTDDQLRAVIEVADAAGLPVTGHTRNIRRAVELGMKHMEHFDTAARALLDPEGKWDPRTFPSPAATVGLPLVAPERLLDPKQFPLLIEYLVKEGVFANPTITGDWDSNSPRGSEHLRAAAELVRDPALEFVPAAVKQAWVGSQQRNRDATGLAYAHMAEFYRQYSEAGGKIVIGTDTGGDARAGRIPGLATHYEMEMLADMGISRMKAIQGATLWNAELLKKDRDLGSIEPGKVADFLVIEGDPLVDIGVTKNVRLVIKDGEVVDTTYDPTWVNPSRCLGDRFLWSSPT
jgi:imidazolonepropionase-like amidohydrolase